MAQVQLYIGHSRPMCLRRSAFLADGEGVTCDPVRIEEIVREAWQKVFAHEADTLRGKALAFCEHRAGLFPSGAEVGLSAHTGNSLWEAARAGPKTSAGPDGWLPAELRLLPTEAFDLLAGLFNAVEAGAKWPKELL
eukprot:9324811-Alexandrium_andersonii.AAC.1